VAVAAALDETAAFPSTSPLVAPALPPLAVAGLLAALLPAWVAPPARREAAA